MVYKYNVISTYIEVFNVILNRISFVNLYWTLLSERFFFSAYTYTYISFVTFGNLYCVNEIFNIFISLLWYRGKARRWIPPLNTWGLQNLAEIRERKGLNRKHNNIEIPFQSLNLKYKILLKAIDIYILSIVPKTVYIEKYKQIILF